MKVAICGPPHSGKSTFTASLIEVIRERQRKQAHQVSVSWEGLDVTDNSIAVLMNPDSDLNQKRDVDWSQERAEERKAVFAARDEQLVIADAPGMVTEELRTVIEPADAMIILASKENEEQISEWRDVASEEGLETFAIIVTILDEDIEVEWEDRVERKGTIQSATREEFQEIRIDAHSDPTRRMLRQVGTDLLKEAGSED